MPVVVQAVEEAMEETQTNFQIQEIWVLVPRGINICPTRTLVQRKTAVNQSTRRFNHLGIREPARQAIRICRLPTLVQTIKMQVRVSIQLPTQIMEEPVCQLELRVILV